MKNYNSECEKIFKILLTNGFTEYSKNIKGTDSTFYILPKKTTIIEFNNSIIILKIGVKYYNESRKVFIPFKYRIQISKNKIIEKFSFSTVYDSLLNSITPILVKNGVFDNLIVNLE